MVITDHQVLTFFKEAPAGSQRRTRWWEYVSHFNFELLYLKGDKNIVANALSCYYLSDEPGERHGVESYVNADSRLDPEGDNLSDSHCRETEELRINTAYVDGLDNPIREQINPTRVEAVILNSDVNTSEVPS